VDTIPTFKILVKIVSYDIIFMYPGTSKTPKVVEKSMVTEPLVTAITDVASRHQHMAQSTV
jgi:hypothetical protein